MPSPTPAPSPVALDELLARSDLLTLHAPLTPDTRHLLGPEAIAATMSGPRVRLAPVERPLMWAPPAQEEK